MVIVPSFKCLLQKKLFFQGTTVMWRSYQPLQDHVVRDTTVHLVPSDLTRKMMPQEVLAHRDTTALKEQDPLNPVPLATLVMLLAIEISLTADCAQQVD